MGTHPIVGAPRDGVNPGPRPRGEPDALEGGSAAHRPWVCVPHAGDRERGRCLPPTKTRQAVKWTETCGEAKWPGTAVKSRARAGMVKGRLSPPPMGFVNGRMLRMPQAARHD